MDEQLPLSIKAEQKGRIRFGLLCMTFQGPNVTRDAREKIAFFAFHAFVRGFSKIESEPNYNTAAHASV